MQGRAKINPQRKERENLNVILPYNHNSNRLFFLDFEYMKNETDFSVSEYVKVNAALDYFMILTRQLSLTIN